MRLVRGRQQSAAKIIRSTFPVSATPPNLLAGADEPHSQCVGHQKYALRYGEVIATLSMKVIVGCVSEPKYEREFAVYALTYDAGDQLFTIPLCVGDDWLQKIKCDPALVPKTFHFQWDRVYITFSSKDKAEAFGAWLIESEARAQGCYETMRG